MAPAPSLVDDYLHRLHALLERFRTTQGAALAHAADLLADSLRRGGIVHLFGTGHSHMIAEEVFYRAGGLLQVNAMLDGSVVLSGGAWRTTETERTPGAATAIASRYDLRAGDCGVVVSHSGRNPAPVEMALLMKSKALPVIAITSVAASQALPPLDPPGARLFEVADAVLDTGGDSGDAALPLPGAPQPVGPTSTVIGAAIVQALVIAAMERLATSGVSIVNLPSGNVPHTDLRAVQAEMQKYHHRIKHW